MGNVHKEIIVDSLKVLY